MMCRRSIVIVGAALLGAALLVAACGSSRGDSADRTSIEVDGRDVQVVAPHDYDGSRPLPLVLSLHGYSLSGASQEAYFQLGGPVDDRQFIAAFPQGTLDEKGSRFWNATDACCNFYGADVDDSTFLIHVIDRLQRDYAIDPTRVYVVGHSNGGFMAYRLACDHADRLAAIVSLAGAAFADSAACRPSSPVSVLQIHGTLDPTILYGGGAIEGRAYPGAVQSAATWAGYDGCGTATDVTENAIDLDADVSGFDTTIAANAGCPAGTAVDLWTINGGSHIPDLTSAFTYRLLDFLFAHPKV